MPATLDDLMQTASQALADMDYARSEALCVQALGQAKTQKDWVMYRRVLLPLQESRRQIRQAALDGPIMLGTESKRDALSDWLAEADNGCIVLSWPYTAAEANELIAGVKAAGRSIEVLFADNKPLDNPWQITSAADAGLRVELPAPKAEWVGRWIDPHATAPPTPAHWFMQANEALGNAALAATDAPIGSVERLEALEQALAAVGDHEILHQRLADAAKALHEARA